LLGFSRSLKVPLYKNSIFLMLKEFATYGFGFLFWIIAARLYSAEGVGIATALISSNIMLATFSGMGLDSLLIRSFPDSKDKSGIFSTCIIVTTIFAFLLGVIFILGINIWSPKLNFQKFEYIFIYMLFLVANSLLTIILTTFIAMRRTEFNFLESLVVGLRVIILFPLISIGATGIFGAYGISFVLAILVALIIIHRLDLKPSFKIDVRFLREGFYFSAGNYVSWLLITAPNLIMPIMVLNTLGARETAHYYIPFSIASLLFIIPTAISTSLFVEGSHGESLGKTASKSLIAAISILIPGVLLLDHFGRWLLGLIGNNYIAGLFYKKGAKKDKHFDCY
jgi:O-antigen/teichoic acid export membrane protein